MIVSTPTCPFWHTDKEQALRCSSGKTLPHHKPQTMLSYDPESFHWAARKGMSD